LIHTQVAGFVAYLVIFLASFVLHGLNIINIELTTALIFSVFIGLVTAIAHGFNRVVEAIRTSRAVPEPVSEPSTMTTSNTWTEAIKAKTQEALIGEIDGWMMKKNVDSPLIVIRSIQFAFVTQDPEPYKAMIVYTDS
jgi:hypothetical protein